MHTGLPLTDLIYAKFYTHGRRNLNCKAERFLIITKNLITLLLNNFASHFLVLGPRFMNRSGKNPSEPHALFGFNVEISVETSSNVT